MISRENFLKFNEEFILGRGVGLVSGDKMTAEITLKISEKARLHLLDVAQREERFELARIFLALRPDIDTLARALVVDKITYENISVGKEISAVSALYRRLVLADIDRAVGKRGLTEAILFSVTELAFVDGAVVLDIFTEAVSYFVVDLADIDVAVGIGNRCVTRTISVVELALENRAVCLGISALSVREIT